MITEKIIDVKVSSAEDLIERMKNVPLKKQPDIKVYENTFITLENIHCNNIFPTQNYIWLKELYKVQELRWGLLEYGVDIFNLNGFVTYTVNYKDDFSEFDMIYDMYPPVVEESFEKDGNMIMLINDGMHRLWLARQEHIIPQVVYVRGIPKEYPYYAFPRVNKWNGIDILEENPDAKIYIKKYHRIKNNKSLYRNFQAVFSNVGGPRGDLIKK